MAEEEHNPPADIVDLSQAKEAREAKIAEQQTRIRAKIMEMHRLHEEIYRQPQHTPSTRDELREITDYIGMLSRKLGDRRIPDQELETLLKFLRQGTDDEDEIE